MHQICIWIKLQSVLKLLVKSILMHPLQIIFMLLLKLKIKISVTLLQLFLNRERHAEIIEEIRAAGARIKLINDGDVAGAINTAFDETGVDILFGLGGAPEGVIAAVGLKCLGGEIQGRLVPSNDEEIERCIKMGIDVNKVLYMEDLVKGDDAIFAATGVTDGELLRGVQFKGGYCETHSLVMRSKSGTIRFVEGRHSMKKKPLLVMQD